MPEKALANSEKDKKKNTFRISWNIDETSFLWNSLMILFPEWRPYRHRGYQNCISALSLRGNTLNHEAFCGPRMSLAIVKSNRLILCQPQDKEARILQKMELVYGAVM